MTKIFISEETKKNQQELSKVNKTFVICENWHEFAANHNKVSFMALPHQTKNGMWGVVYWWRECGAVDYYSASEDVSLERKEIDQLSKLYISLGISNNPNSSGQSPKTNTGNNSIEFSIAYANYVVKKLVEYNFQFHCSLDKDKASEEWNKVMSKSTIDVYQEGEYQNLKNDDDLVGLKNKISQWESATWTKDPETVKNWYKPLQDYWHANFSKDYSEGYGIGENGLVRIKDKLDQLEADKGRLSNKVIGLQISNYLLTKKVDGLKEDELKRKLKTIVGKFAGEQLKLEGFPIDLYCNRKNEGKFIGEWSNAVGLSDWRKKIVNGKRELDYSGFYIHIRIDRPSLDVFYTLAHELSHLTVLLKEVATGKLFPDQLHSKAFWNDFFLDYKGSNFAFVENNLEGEEKEGFAKLLNPITNKIKNDPINQKVYSPMIISKWENKKLLRKTFASSLEIDKESKEVMELALGLAEKGMQESDWGEGYESESREKRKVQIEFDEQEIRVYYDERLPTKSELESELTGLGFTQEEINQQQKRTLFDQQAKEESYGCLFKIALEEKSSQLIAQQQVSSK